MKMEGSNGVHADVQVEVVQGRAHCGHGRPVEIRGLSPETVGPSDESCGMGDAAAGESRGDGETVICDTELHLETEGGDDLLHMPSPKVKPTWNTPASPGKLLLSPPGGSRKGLVKGALNSHSMSDIAALADLSLVETEEECKAGGHAKTVSNNHSTTTHHDDAHHKEVLEHTIGTVKEDSRVLPVDKEHPRCLRRSQSTLEIHEIEASDEDEQSVEEAEEKLLGENLLVVFDMDHTLVGNLVALSDRDNVETNIEWKYWPDGCEHGLGVEKIIPYLERGMLRPGVIQLIQYLTEIGATMVVYTHSEERWAKKVCEAMEKVIGIKFITRMFSRQYCRDGHPEFLAKKSLEFIVDCMKEEEGLEWASVDKCIMFDDDKNAVYAGEQSRLIRVQSYDFWEPCQWDEIITEEVLDKNPQEVIDLVRRTVVEWGVAPPSYGKDILTEEDVKIDERWAEQREKKEVILMSYNKVSKMDRVMQQIRNSFKGVTEFDEDAMEGFPERIRKSLGTSTAGAGARRRMF